MCDRLRCEKNGEPVIEECQDCLVPVDGADPEMYKKNIVLEINK